MAVIAAAEGAAMIVMLVLLLAGETSAESAMGLRVLETQWCSSCWCSSYRSHRLCAMAIDAEGAVMLVVLVLFSLEASATCDDCCHRRRSDVCRACAAPR